MNFADNWARVFVVITFLTFGEAQIIGGIVPNLIAFSLFLVAIGYFASTGKMAVDIAEKLPHLTEIRSNYQAEALKIRINKKFN